MEELKHRDRGTSVQSEMSPAEVAAHEAGHAVAAYLLGVPFEWITTEAGKVRSRTTFSGCVALINNWFDPNERLTPEQCLHAERYVMALLAGTYTQGAWYQRKHGVKPDETALAKQCEQDRIQAWNLALSLSREDPYVANALQLESALETNLDGLVTASGATYWYLVEGLADAVEGGKTLSWNETATVLAEVEREHGMPSLMSSWMSTSASVARAVG